MKIDITKDYERFVSVTDLNVFGQFSYKKITIDTGKDLNDGTIYIEVEKQQFTCGYTSKEPCRVETALFEYNANSRTLVQPVNTLRTSIPLTSDQIIIFSALASAMGEIDVDYPHKGLPRADKQFWNDVAFWKEFLNR